ncbi:MAG: fenitrothion hydrolase [Thermoleophilaceae bacterium]
MAHGIVGRSDLPIPEWLFGWAAAVVLVVSFVALAVLWPQPRLQDGGLRALPGALSAVLTSRAVEVVCGAVGVGLLFLVVYSGLRGVQVASANFASNFVFVVFWVGLVPASVLLGDVFRAFNPWRALGRTVAWISQTAAREPMPAPLAYPQRLGYLPAAAGLLAFTALELVASSGSQPKNVAVATLAYSAITFVAMALYGVEEWSRKGEAFGVYFSLFARISVWTRRGERLGLRKPLSGLAEFEPLPGSVLLLAVMIGTVTFDGAGEGPLWTGAAPRIQDLFESIGLSPEKALEGAFFIGLCAGVALIFGFYRLGMTGAASVGGNQSVKRLTRAFVHTLVPIATAYVMAHYLTFLLYQGQSMKFLVSNPLGGNATNIFGTADDAIDYGVIGATTAWYCQVGFVVVGHVAALTMAHDRALVTYDKARLAVRSQYWMLLVMIGFTLLALWLLAQSNG